jgi:signal transduction histidine kinase/CheY-like chemotaxis protein
MTSATARMALVVLGLLLVLTYLLLRGFTPDAALHEQRLRAIDELTFNEAALHRDVLKASHGLLLDYDPLVATVARLREVVAELRGAGAPGPLLDGIASELDRQEALVEDFKSAHALLRNSLAYFAYLSEQLTMPTSEPGQAVAMVVGRFASAMFRFVGSASSDAAAADVAASLDELSVQPVPADLRDDTEALRAHGALILRNQPLVDGILARLLATRVSEQAQRLQDHFMEHECPLHQRGGSTWSPEGHERYGCVEVSSVAALPRSEEKARLTACGVRAWLCVPLWHAGTGVGVLGFDAVMGDKRWTNDDIALLRTIGEILVNALFRERGERERQTLESRLRHAQRMESLGTLAGGIAHDFNNILGAILGYAEMLLGRLRRDSPEWRHVEEVKKAGERARDIVDRILAFSRRTEQRHRSLRLRPLLEETAGLLRASLPSTIALGLRLPDEDAPNKDAIVLGEPGRLQQVIMNLCTNAAQAMAGHGNIDVALDLVALDTEQVLSHGALAAGRYVRLTVRDSGHGMDAATLDRIFEPFFTTKEVGAGTGLGLAMVHGIVADHGGAIDVRSRPGAGSSFGVYFRQAEAPPADDGRTDAPLAVGRGETILIVDDEKPLVQLGEEMVATLGYEPVGFDSSTRALAAFRADPQRFDLVLADEIMPGMTGTQLAAALHAIRPDLPILLMTGYSGPGRSARPDVCEILKKPLLSADIAGAIARHLHPEHQVAAVS